MNDGKRSRGRLSERLSAGAALVLTLGGAYYFIAAVNWVRTGYWPDWSLRRLGLDLAGATTPGVITWLVDVLEAASPGFLALLTAAVLGVLALLFDRLPVRRGSAVR